METFHIYKLSLFPASFLDILFFFFLNRRIFHTIFLFFDRRNLISVLLLHRELSNLFKHFPNLWSECSFNVIKEYINFLNIFTSIINTFETSFHVPFVNFCDHLKYFGSFSFLFFVLIKILKRYFDIFCFVCLCK